MGDDEQPQEEAPTSVRRASTGTMVAIQLVLAFVLLLSLNYLAGTHHRTWDHSQNRQFTLSAQTEKLLNSGLVQDRSKPVRIIAAVRRSSAAPR